MKISRVLIGIITLGFFFAILANPASAKTIKGTVFLDVNKNLKLDKDEPGIQGVLVSNQRDVVITDKNGKYQLTIDDNAIIFITKPSGYITPLDENNLPKFYYIHQPNGSPKLKYPGIKPTGKLPRRLNFPLFESEESDTFEIIVFGDPQSRNETEIGYLRDVFASEMSGVKVAFGIQLGDIVFDNLSLYEKQPKIFSRVGFPFYLLPGNHDENYDAKSDQFATETYKSYFGPNYYSFDYGQVHFVMLDNVDYLQRDENGHVHYQGLIGEKQLQWIKNDLQFVAPEKLIVINMHIPLYYGDGKNPGLNVVDREKLFEILKGGEHLLVLAGHMHIVDHYFLDEQEGWTDEKPLHQIICAAACGAWWSGPKDIYGIPLSMQEDGTPKGYHLIKFEGSQYNERYKAAGEPVEYQMRISYPVGKILYDDLPNRQIVVNVFDGSEKSVVKYQIDELPWTQMKKSFIKDPFFDTVYSRSGESTPSWIKPKPSTHIWTASFPEGLKKGVHRIVIKTIDQFGNCYQATKIFEIE